MIKIDAMLVSPEKICYTKNCALKIKKIGCDLYNHHGDTDNDINDNINNNKICNLM